MSEVESKKLALIGGIRTGELSPQDAVKEFEKLTPTQVRTGRIYTSKSPAERVAEYKKARAERDAVQSNKVPFISPGFYPDFYLCQGLVLVGAESGHGKSTVGSNVEAGILQYVKNSRVMHITNEENVDAVYGRIAAVMLKIPFYKIHHKTLAPHEQRKVEEFIGDELVSRVEVVGDDGRFDMSDESDVVSVMETAAQEGYTAIVLDYHQNIVGSRANPQKETFKISKDMGLFYKTFGKKYAVPVIVFAQLSAGTEARKFKDRVENDKTLYNHSFAAIEVIPNFENKTSEFKIHKDRFCDANAKNIVMELKGGRYEVQGGGSL